MRANRILMSWKDAMVFGFALPPVPELGMADGFDVFLQDLAAPDMKTDRSQKPTLGGSSSKSCPL